MYTLFSKLQTKWNFSVQNHTDVEFQCYQCSEYDTDAKGVKTLKSKGATDTCAEFRKIEKANKYKWKRNKTLDGRKPELEAFVNTCKIDTNGSLPSKPIIILFLINFKNFGILKLYSMQSIWFFSTVCYNLKGTDRRIIAFDEKGCGLGPENLRIMRPSDSKADGKQNIAEMCEYKPLDFKKQLTELNFLDEVKKNQGLVEMVNCICTESFCNGGNGFW